MSTSELCPSFPSLLDKLDGKVEQEEEGLKEKKEEKEEEKVDGKAKMRIRRWRKRKSRKDR